MTKDILIKNVIQLQETQMRIGISEETILDYMESYKKGENLPPVVLCYNSVLNKYYLADGFHRVEARKRLKYTSVSAEVFNGTYRDAVLFSAGANASHGLRRSNADKRKAIANILSDPEWVMWSNAEIARVTKTSSPLVQKLREELDFNVLQPIKKVVNSDKSSFSSTELLKYIENLSEDEKIYVLSNVNKNKWGDTDKSEVNKVVKELKFYQKQSQELNVKLDYAEKYVSELEDKNQSLVKKYKRVLTEMSSLKTGHKKTKKVAVIINDLESQLDELQQNKAKIIDKSSGQRHILENLAVIQEFALSTVFSTGLLTDELLAENSAEINRVFRLLIKFLETYNRAFRPVHIKDFTSIKET